MSFSSYISSNILLLSLLAAIIIGLFVPSLGIWISEFKIGETRIFQLLNIITIFIISGLTLKASELVSALSNWCGILYGVFAILVVTPLFGFLTIQLPFSHFEFAIGFTLFSCVPTTINSCAMISSIAFANQAMAILLTCVTNFIGSATTPAILQMILNTSSGISIDSVAILVSLLTTVLVPLLLGCIIRLKVPGAPVFLQTWSQTLSTISNLSVAAIVWQTMSRSHNELSQLKWTTAIVLLLSGAFLHICFLVVNHVFLRVITLKRTSSDPLRIPNFEYKAILLTASQKSLPICVTILANIAKDEESNLSKEGNQSSIGSIGLITVACICGHTTQLLIDTVLAPCLATWYPNNDFFSSGNTVEDSITYVSDLERPLLKPNNLKTIEI